MKKLSAMTLLFAILFLVFFIALVFLRFPFSPYPLMSVQDAIDILTPLVLLPLYFVLFRLNPQKSFGFPEIILFIIFAAFWASGQGMHLSANSIDNLLGQQGIKNGDIYKLTYFMDEYLSHYLWHIGVIGLSGVLIYRQWKNPFSEGKMIYWAIILAAVIYGFTYFLIIMEGNTWPVGIPLSVIAVLIILIWDRRGLGKQPLSVFFLSGYAFSMLLFLIWGIINGGLPPIMDVIKI